MTRQQELALEAMADGIYLMKTKEGVEGLGWWQNVERYVSSGTINELLNEDFIRLSFEGKNFDRYVLTDKGRQFKRK